MSDSYETQFQFVDLTLLEMERPVGHLLKEEIAERIEGVCIGKISDNQLSVAVSDPTRIEIYNIIEVFHKLCPHFSQHTEVTKIIEHP